MKKYFVLFLMMIITLSFYGCNTAENMIGTKNGVAYFNKTGNVSEIICTYYSETQDEEIEVKLENAPFCDKIGEIIDGKPAGDDFCKCAGDYQVTIDNKYLFYLHEDKIVVFTDMKDYTGFTVECSAEETKELYEIIEPKN